jgi:hypothetical protein
LEYSVLMPRRRFLLLLGIHSSGTARPSAVVVLTLRCRVYLLASLALALALLEARLEHFAALTNQAMDLLEKHSAEL